jgi:hypothetical protein
MGGVNGGIVKDDGRHGISFRVTGFLSIELLELDAVDELASYEDNSV